MGDSFCFQKMFSNSFQMALTLTLNHTDRSLTISINSEIFFTILIDSFIKLFFSSWLVLWCVLISIFIVHWNYAKIHFQIQNKLYRHRNHLHAWVQSLRWVDITILGRNVVRQLAWLHLADCSVCLLLVHCHLWACTVLWLRLWHMVVSFFLINS